MEKAEIFQKRIKMFLEGLILEEERRQKNDYSKITNPQMQKLKDSLDDLEKNSELHDMTEKFLVLFQEYCEGINENILGNAKNSIKTGKASLRDDTHSISTLLYILDMGMGIAIDLASGFTPEQIKEKESIPIQFEFAYLHIQAKKNALWNYLTPFERDSYRPKLEELIKSEEDTLNKLREEKKGEAQA